MLFGAHAHRILESILLSPYFHDTRNAPPCTNPAKQEAMQSKAWLPVFEPGCRAAAPAGCAEGSAPARSPEAERSGPRHFAGFRRKIKSVIVGSYTFAESAVPSSPRAPNETHHTIKERLTIKIKVKLK